VAASKYLGPRYHHADSREKNTVPTDRWDTTVRGLSRTYSEGSRRPERVTTVRGPESTDTPGTKPSGVAWAAIDDERVEEIPILQRLRDRS